VDAALGGKEFKFSLVRPRSAATNSPVGADPGFSVINDYDAAFNIPLVGAAFADRISYVISPEGRILYAYSDSNAEKHIWNYAGRRQEMARGAQALSLQVSALYSGMPVTDDQGHVIGVVT
jgi:CBS domain-containing protein